MVDGRRCLVLANQTLCGDEVVRAVEDRTATGRYVFHVVVPATPLRDQDAAPGGGDEMASTGSARAYALARQRLDRGLERIRELGVDVSGEVGDPDPLVAARLALGRFPADEVIVVTLPRGLSRWLRADLPARVARSHGLPVAHVVEPDGRP